MGFDLFRQGRNSIGLDQNRQRQLNFELLLYFRHHAHREKGLAAQIKETDVGTNGRQRHIQHLLPNLR